jgi:hypothetical protein
MPDKKTFNKQEKDALLKSFGTPLNNQSLRIIERFKDSGKDLNKMLKTAWTFKHLC